MGTQSVLWFFFAICAIIVGAFVYVALTTRRPAAVDADAASRHRRTFFVALGLVLLGFLAVTLPKMPYAAAGGAADEVVYVTGRQSMFTLGAVPVENIEDWEAHFSKSVDVKAGSTVEFSVTTLDVNHSFGVYTPEGVLLAQTQVMPGYANRLRVRFDAPGTYTVLCLEYCGIDHHNMRGLIQVR